MSNHQPENEYEEEPVDAPAPIKRKGLKISVQPSYNQINPLKTDPSDKNAVEVDGVSLETESVSNSEPDEDAAANELLNTVEEDDEEKFQDDNALAKQMTEPNSAQTLKR